MIVHQDATVTIMVNGEAVGTYRHARIELHESVQGEAKTPVAWATATIPLEDGGELHVMQRVMRGERL